MNMLGMYGEEIAPLVAGLLAVGMFYKWFWAGDIKPDPWESDEATSENTDDDEPACQRCLNVVPVGNRFCPDCGAIADPLCGYLPFINALALGDVTRRGLNEQGHLRPLIWSGLALIALATIPFYVPFYPYSFLGVPIYLLLFAMNRRRMRVPT
jgi:hypothetical protein